MKYSSGEQIRLGDLVRLGDDSEGVVVCSIDADEYSLEYPRAQWSYLGRGVVVVFPKFGPIHYQQPEDDLTLVSRCM
ncbi:hypothetical protein JQ557_32125 [Bradyrhizobium sp. U87765 SZCCT0131]|uniref:hypothetical protein n=1 Tax=unclassified Bradyrhizobium TaxID=2631580 RepID=UPI001BA53856|nr:MULTISPECIES: hypothetical protein [unclassified Bradyrhizobium]MBR1222686.1 hypothetical protein [Bradyrhizobium sp. U87765 SZCCT0131]MBR1265233.1 hypothetical protein [Bradyrhizobium sp. U87765 SZCCT0134]MBR1302988.1 hypothetical protein [Bradyrhizobium sp. U87765 SZCCT0110]MBR1323686.1 hypothetical protein [Bradyrhizobium sp. U87765 SZCCT0109]MBR1346917.1 hypothetical protein [Bradyrhizobium sp. U87765 SZCCT0048]